MLEKAAKMGLCNCMGLKKGESVLIITEEKARNCDMRSGGGVRELGAEATLMEMLERPSHGAEPPRAVAEAAKQADVKQR